MYWLCDGCGFVDTNDKRRMFRFCVLLKAISVLYDEFNANETEWVREKERDNDSDDDADNDASDYDITI